MNRAWYVLRATWNWLWGKPIDSGGEVSVQIGEDSVEDMERGVESLTRAVAQQKTALNQVLQLYEETSSNVNRLQEQAERMLAAGNEDVALELLTEQDALDDYLPQLEQQVSYAEQTLNESTATLKEQTILLKKMQAQQRMSESTMQVTKALEQANQAAGIDSSSARRRFERSQAAVKRRNNLAQATSQVRNELTGTSRAIRKLSAADRLKALKAQKIQKSLEEREDG